MTFMIIWYLMNDNFEGLLKAGKNVEKFWFAEQSKGRGKYIHSLLSHLVCPD